MTFRVNANSLKNAMGTMFLLAAAFFVCSTFISMRSVFADPVAPAGALPQRAGRTSPRATSNTNATRSSVSRAAVTRTTSAAKSGNTRTTVASRGISTNRTVSPRGVTATRTNAVSSRGVASRTRSNTNRSTDNRTVRARTSSTPSRVSATGNVMSGSRASTSTTYSYLSSKLYTGSYSNIIDSSTGLISADAYSNCLESYYTCMDEICTARSDTKGRCSCAGRATNFLDAEAALEKANEELITLSGQLSLLIATKGKGKDLAYAFSLTDAEKVMNCVSYKEKVQAGDMSEQDWYEEHPTVDASGNKQTSGVPTYCEDSGNNFGFDIRNIDGSSSDILAQLQAWADAKDLAKEYTTNNNNDLVSKYSYVAKIVDDMSGIQAGDTGVDTLANKWGYALFQYAHNKVCGRVLDSCFNGIYEACGTPKSVTEDGKTVRVRCGNGASSNCPFNYNSYISIDTDSGDVILDDRSNNSSSSSSASCFGYTTTTTNVRGVASSSADPYVSLRGPVADARRSVMQKYLLDANAACDTYGAALKKTAQNINYQKIAAEQALQQKRLEFKQQEESQLLADATDAIDNFNECISEIWDCYEQYKDQDNWTTARIKSYCAQSSQVPHCYETMICSPLQTQLIAVVDKPDSATCKYSNDYTENTCRNVVTINEILYGTGSNANPQLDGWSGIGYITVNSAAVREQCLERALGCTETGETGDTYCLRNWKKSDANSTDPGTGTLSGAAQTISSGQTACGLNLLNIANATSGYIKDGDCYATQCKTGYVLNDGVCTTASCGNATLAALNATAGYLDGGNCIITECANGYMKSGNKCLEYCSETTLSGMHATSGYMQSGTCHALVCESGYDRENDTCVVHE